MDSLFVPLTTIARRGYDERDVDAKIKANEWTVFEGKDYCPDCWGQMQKEIKDVPTKIKKGGV